MQNPIMTFFHPPFLRKLKRFVKSLFISFQSIVFYEDKNTKRSIVLSFYKSMNVVEIGDEALFSKDVYHLFIKGGASPSLTFELFIFHSELVLRSFACVD